MRRGWLFHVLGQEGRLHGGEFDVALGVVKKPRQPRPHLRRPDSTKGEDGPVNHAGAMIFQTGEDIVAGIRQMDEDARAPVHKDKASAGSVDLF